LNDRLWALKNAGIKGCGDQILCLDFQKREESEISLEEAIDDETKRNSTPCRSEAKTLVKGEKSMRDIEHEDSFGSFGAKTKKDKFNSGNSDEENLGFGKGSVVSNTTKNSYSIRMNYDISVFIKDSVNDQIIIVYNNYLIKICYKDKVVKEVQELGLKNTIDPIYSSFYKFLADSAYLSSKGILILAFRAPQPNNLHSTRSFADPNCSMNSSIARLCFFDLNNTTKLNTPTFIKEIVIGGKNRSKIEYLNSFGSLSIDPSENYLLISGNQAIDEKQSRAQILSLHQNNFLEVLASQNFEENVFTEHDYWLKGTNFVLANGLGSLILAKVVKSNLYGLRISERKIDQSLIAKNGKFIFLIF